MDKKLEDALKHVVENYEGNNSLVEVHAADHLIYDELKRTGFLSHLEYDLTGNAIVVPTHAAISYFSEGGVSNKQKHHNPAQFETFKDSYRKIKNIGNGGAGDVYEVESSDRTKFALKVLNESANRNSSKRKRFLQEAFYENSCKCSAVVPVCDMGVLGTGDSRRPFYVMPLMDGSFADLLKDAPEGGVDFLLKLLLDLMRGLMPFYDVGNFHRDIKPQNLLYDAKQERLMLADLGIAHIADYYPGATVETVSSERLANFQYAAPEQREKGKACDQRADIYAFGLILNQIFTNSVPQGSGYKLISDVNPDYSYLDSVVEK